jgi:hypothetical protein
MSLLWTSIYTRIYTGHMRTRESASPQETGFERMMFSLPKPLVAELKKYACVLRGGNKSGFVSDAVRSYIDHFRRRRHTALLRESYRAAAESGRTLAREWEPLDEETWSRLDELERKSKTSR